MNNICKTCQRKSICGNNYTKEFCTGYIKVVNITYSMSTPSVYCSTCGKLLNNSTCLFCFKGISVNE